MSGDQEHTTTTYDPIGELPLQELLLMYGIVGLVDMLTIEQQRALLKELNERLT